MHLTNGFFQSQIIKWYKSNKRDLPWRELSDPYLIWLSEILLQQTKVGQGLPYFIKFKNTFPDVQSLALAEEEEVLKLWQGLGYYSRARNLHAAAREVVRNGGKLPTSYKDLLKMKGVGEYTAAAIASFAYNEKVAVLDGNVIRVLTRLFGISDDIASPSTISNLRKLANELLPDMEHATYNQGIMEFGALHCTPANPNCPDCPVAEICFARKNKMQKSLPRKIKKLKKKDRYFQYMIFSIEGKLHLKRRGKNDIWEGLYDFYLWENSGSASEKDILEYLACQGMNVHEFSLHNESGIYKHVLTHQNIYAKFWHVVIKEKNALQTAVFGDMAFYGKEEVDLLPKPVLINNYLKQCFF